MSKKVIKSQASSARAASGAFGEAFGQGQAPFGSGATTFGSVPSSHLSYVYEPPALTGISDSNVIVAFKNVQKKDATTKAKALEDLQNYVDSSEQRGVEEAVLEAWIRLYPRTSIDSSRRVRQLAHIFQGRVGVLCGKRLARYMPSIVPSWLAGQQDPDKAVSRAARDSFNQVFATEEKSKNVWRVYHHAIFEYAENIVLSETESTLSDMRTTSHDDASSKYARVVGCAVTVLASLTNSVDPADIEKSSSTFANLVNAEALWKLANHDDAFVRRAIFRLLITCLDNQPQMLNFSLLSTQVVNKGLHTSQSGSSLDFIKALVRLSEVKPTVWTSSYQGTGKKSASHRLLHFLRKGSQGAPVTFWNYISPLLNPIPDEVVFASPVESSSEHEQEHMQGSSESEMLPVLEALRAGITSRNEPQSNAFSAWNSYLDVCEHIISSKSHYNKPIFVQKYLFLLIHQYIRPSPDLIQWTVAGHQQEIICAKAAAIAFRVSSELSHDEWQNLSSKVVEDFQTSLPEQSKDHIRSQESIALEASRWYRLQARSIVGPSSESVIGTVRQQLVKEITAAIAVVTFRNGKPFGVAAALHVLAQLMPQLALDETPAKDALVNFAETKLPQLMVSPSGLYLIRLLDVMVEYVEISSAYTRCIEIIEGALESSAGQGAMKALLSSPGVAKAGKLSIAASKVLTRATDDVLRENDQLYSSLLMAALQNAFAPKELTDEILSILTNDLSVENSTQSSLRVLEYTTKHNRTALTDFAANARGSDLIAKLLFLSEGSDTATSQQATSIMKEIETSLETNGNAARSTQPLLNAIQREFRLAQEESLTIDSLVGQAEKILKQAPETDVASTILELLPKPDDWEHALEPFIERPLNPALAMTNPFGPAIMMIQPEHDKVAPAPPMAVSHDLDGRTVLLRVLQYVTKFVKAADIFSQASEDQKLTLLHYVALSVQIAEDNISISGAMPLWVTEDPEVEAEIVESIFEAQRLLARISQAAQTSSVTPYVLARLLENSEGYSSSSYYHARAYLTVLDGLNESERKSSIATSANRIKAIHSSPNIFANMAVLMSCDSKDVVKPCNELLSHLTDQNFESQDKESLRDGFRRLLMMNCILQRSDEIIHDIPQRRLILYVQHVIGEVRVASFGPEIVRSLAAILPAIKDIYGSFWAESLYLTNRVQQCPLDDMHLVVYHACFKLCAILAKQDILEANDDLLDAWTERKQSVMRDALKVLKRASLLQDDRHTPRRILNELLSRLLEGSSQLLQEETETLFPVLASQSIILQRTAFELLHEQLPLKQEQVSLDKALAKDFQVNLPEELLSLILAPPIGPELSESSQNTTPAPLRSYLLTWILIFDHWKNASNMLQVDYAKSLAEGTYLTDLLDMTFAMLTSPGGKAVDISKMDIENYVIDAEPPERDVQWLLSHLYFLCLKYLPTQSKAWWRDTTSRQTNIAVEAWTQKYVSKHVIASELNTVREWGPSQNDGDQPLTVKVLSSANEISASIPVDEDFMILAIRLPPSYPLARAEVEGVRRVGVPEKKWTSWIRNTQGQLTIASEGGANALIDCLLAWRKNVTATMKGQTECAICYSVVAADRSLPSKVCKTCKNKFHGSCLFRWFSSSNSSSCPLCRNTFTYS